MKGYLRKLCVLLIVMTLSFIALSFKTFAVSTKISVIWSNPGEDCSSEVSFAWQSTSEISEFYFTLASDTSFANAKKYVISGEKTNAFDTYAYKFDVDNLSPNTSYIYKISSGDSTSEVYTVTTASNAGDFSFIWTSDMHVHPNASERITFTNKLYTKIAQDSELPINLIVGTGDEVAYGGSKTAYEQLTNLKQNPSLQTMMWANIPGNHTYYADGKASLKDAEGGGNLYFEAMTNHPDNGFSDVNSSYWFIYNSVMFVLMDSLSIQISSTKLSDQQAWLKQVVSENEGKFQYLIVGQHYPWMNALTGAKSASYTSTYSAWYKVFDEVGVDIAIAGDYHTYYRSNKIYNDQVVADDASQGTVYMGNRQIGGRAAGGSYYIKERQNEEYYACRLDNPTATTSGCGYFTVTTKGIEWKMYDCDTLKVVDECFIPAKRGINWEPVKDKVAESSIFTASGNTGYINFNTSYKDYVKKMDVYYASGQLALTIEPSKDKTSTAIINNLELNKAYQYKIKYTFVDDTTKEAVVYGNTYGDYGEIYGFNISSNGEKFTATFNADLKNNVVKSFEIRQDDKNIAAFSVSDSKLYNIVLENAKMNLDSTFTLNALNASGNIIFSTKKQYTYYGDVNVSGKFDMDDVDSAFKYIMEGKEFSGNALNLNNFNNDNKFDIGDVILMYKALKEGKSKIKAPAYTVVFLDFDGEVISTQIVKENENAVLPEFKEYAGYEFDYLSGSYKQITSDIVIKAIYKAVE